MAGVKFMMAMGALYTQVFLCFIGNINDLHI
jgi:hypothetical protein